MTQEDLDFMREFMKEKQIDPLNTRQFKNGDSYELTVGSIDKHSKEHEFKGKKVKVTYGEFAEYLKESVFYLEQARKYCANET